MYLIQVNQFDFHGGAAQVAFNIHKHMIANNHESFFWVQNKSIPDTNILEIPLSPPIDNIWANLIWKIYKPLSYKIGYRRIKFLYDLMDPLSAWHRSRGFEVFNFPGSKNILYVKKKLPDVVHLHNLHENYFDLRFLPTLSSKVPTVLTMHDEWLYTGHCAYTLMCERWKIGCGDCPDLAIYPKIPRDSTKHNWKQKKQIFNKSTLCIVTPSIWLKNRAQESLIAKGNVQYKHIPNGIDQKIFRPEIRSIARKELGIKEHTFVICCQGVGDFNSNQFKDFLTLKKCVNIILDRIGEEKILVLCFGSNKLEGEFESDKVETRGFIKDRNALAQIYSAADIYLHPAHSEICPLAILEALSCGTPVIASKVGGIPEIIQHGVNGFLVDEMDAESMADFAIMLIKNRDMLKKLKFNAINTSRPFYSISRMVNDYLRLYKELI